MRDRDDDEFEPLRAVADAARLRWDALERESPPAVPLPIPAAMLPRVPAPKRPRWCALCGCALEAVATYCPPCGRTAALDRRRAQLAEAIETLPKAHAWARLDAPALAALVGEAHVVAAAGALEAPMVLLTGRAGAGKTSLAAAMCRALVDRALDLDAASPADVDRARGLRFVASFDLASARADHALGRGEPAIVNATKFASVLVLDDLGAEPKVHNSPVGEVIHHRHAQSSSTIVTAGFGLSDLRERYGEGIVRRLVDRAVVIRLGGAS